MRIIAPEVIGAKPPAVFHFLFWDILLFMFIGMAFYKSGIITGNHPAKTYWLLFIIGLGVGLPLSYFRLQPYVRTSI